MSSAKLDATSHRWLAALSTFNFSLKYRSGKTNIDADFLSRHSPEEYVVFNDCVQALFHSVLSSPEETPAFECVSLSQIAIPQESSPFSDVNWKVEQRKDSTISRVIELVTRGHKPTKRLICLEREEVRKYLREWQNLYLKGDILYRKTKVGGCPVDQLALPESFFGLVSAGLHDSIGHQGIERTLSLVKSRFYWPGIDSTVEAYVRKCPRCIQRKTPSSVSAGLVSIHSTYPLELVCMDFLSLEMSKGGYEIILVMTDHYTHFAQAFATKNQTARTTTKVLFDNFICHYGFPSRIHSDQGRYFESSVIQELCKLGGISKSRTTPYHLQGNGMAERFNSTLLNMLGTLEDKSKENWKAFIPALVHAYNSTKHETTGFIPHFLMFSRHPRLALESFLGLDPEGFRGTKTEYARDLRSRLNFAYKVASREARKQAKCHKKRYNRRVRHSKLEPGDRVLVRNVGLKGKCKLADRWSQEVYTVVAQPNPIIPVFEVKPEATNAPSKLLHRNLILPFMGLPVEEPNLPGDKSNSQQISLPVLDKYVIPARRNGSNLRPEAPPFVPRHTTRPSKPPAWMDDRWKFL